MPVRAPPGVVGGLLSLLLLALSACHMPAPAASETGGGRSSGTAPTGGASSASGLLPAPVQPVPQQWDRAKIVNAVGQLDGLAVEALKDTGVPGLAVAVVYQDEVIYAKGFGVRIPGSEEPVDPDTVFQVASVSKPVASTVVAGVVGRNQATWTDPVRTYNPDFALKDPYVTANADLADLFSHRAGLHTGAGDLLEDLGWDQQYILGKLNQQPLNPFREKYEYSNFGVTEGGVAAAKAAGTTWEDLADKTLFEKIGMTSSSYRHADFEACTNKALISVPVGSAADKTWEAKNVRDADAEAPAGGLSSSVNDMAKFMRLHLANGTFEGQQIIDPAALQVTRVPHMDLNQPTNPAVRTNFYGLGWNVSSDDQGRVRMNHSGAFDSGASTNVALVPGEQVGIVALTNGRPQGVPEAITNAFFDAVQNGRPTVAWLPFWKAVFAGVEEQDAQPSLPWRTRPANPAAPRTLATYAGTYDNSYYGPLVVRAGGGKLTMSMGPEASPTTFALTAFDGDTFTFETIGENANGPAGATFEVRGSRATAVTLSYYDTRGLGTFTR